MATKKQIKAMRDNASKPRLSFMLDFPTVFEEVSKAMSFGAEKYEKNNWKKGLNIRSLEDSMMRHIIAFHNGEEIDEDSGCNHMALAICNACFLIENHEVHGDEIDDR